jgi:hypothetical protein
VGARDKSLGGFTSTSFACAGPDVLRPSATMRRNNAARREASARCVVTRFHRAGVRAAPEMIEVKAFEATLGGACELHRSRSVVTGCWMAEAQTVAGSWKS